MNNDIQRTLLAAMMALTLGAGSALAAAPEKDPGQKSAAAASGMQPMQQSATSESATSAATYDTFNALDANRDGSIDKQEADASKVLSAQFARLDKNSDGKLSITEFNNASNMASIKVDKKAKGY
jgi:Ca2+-binding EF-hand superfamily protein